MEIYYLPPKLKIYKMRRCSAHHSPLLEEYEGQKLCIK